jgi:hypothetical protein
MRLSEGLFAAGIGGNFQGVPIPIWVAALIGWNNWTGHSTALKKEDAIYDLTDVCN